MSEYKDYNWQNEQFTCAHSYLLPEIAKLLSGKETILDLGCGNGVLANYLIEKGYNVYGTDASQTGITIANRKNPGRFCIQNLATDLLPEELSTIRFDTIISTEVIEHLYDPRKYVLFCKQVLKGKGRLILSTPYNGYLKYLALALVGGMDRHLTVLWDGGHIKFWSKKTLTLLLEEQGFKVTQFIGCGRFPYLWKSMILVAELK